MRARLDMDEDYIRLAATAAALIAAALAVADCMLHGMLTTAQHLAVTVAAFLVIRVMVGLSLRSRHTPAPATADDDTEEN